MPLLGIEFDRYSRKIMEYSNAIFGRFGIWDSEISSIWSAISSFDRESMRLGNRDYLPSYNYFPVGQHGDGNTIPGQKAH